jgi:hypothetical protein
MESLGVEIKATKEQLRTVVAKNKKQDASIRKYHERCRDFEDKIRRVN